VVQVETAAVAALDKAEAEQSGPGGGGRQYMNMLLQLLRLRQACNHPWLVKGAPGVPDAFSSSVGGSSGTSGGSQAGGARGATAAEVSAVRRLAPDSQAALLQVGVALRACLSICTAGIVQGFIAVEHCHVDCYRLLNSGRTGGFTGSTWGEMTCAQLIGCGSVRATVCAGPAGLQQHVWLMWGCTRGPQHHPLLPHLL
jgi:hypothetical protein